MKHPYRRRFLYLGFQLLRVLAQLLPFGASRALGGALGLAAYGLLGTYRRLTHGHLNLAFGAELSPRERKRIARRVFVHLGQNAVEWLRLPRLSSAKLRQLIDAEGVEHLRQALSRGNGAIVVTAHFGNWELIPLYLRGLGFEGGVLARRLRYPEYESFLIGIRGDKGVPTFARGSVKEVARVLRANQIIGVLPDQDMDSLEGVFVRFFGHPAYTPAGPAALSLMTGAPILPCFLLRQGARFRLVIEPSVRIPETRDRAQAITLLTQAWSDVVESHIRRHPDHWVWMHRRWKTQPPPESDERRATQEQRHATSDMRQAAQIRTFRVACCLLLVAVLGGCAKPTPPNTKSASPASVTTESQADQTMSTFTLTGYAVDGGKRWELNGEGAAIDGQIVTIHHPSAIGYEPDRTAYLTASAAQVNQTNRHVRMEHDVTLHTSEGIWFSSPLLHWMPDQNQVATDAPVRIETDHMLIQGRGATGMTQLKYAQILTDVEAVLNPTEQETSSERSHVTITCDGPLSFDYGRHIATFEQNVHVNDPSGDLYSDKLIAYLNGATHTIRYAEASGHVRITQHGNSAFSERAVYEPASGKITLVGKPSLLVYPEGGAGGAAPVTLSGLTTIPMPPPPPPREPPPSTESGS